MLKKVSTRRVNTDLRENTEGSTERISDKAKEKKALREEVAEAAIVDAEDTVEEVEVATLKERMSTMMASRLSRKNPTSLREEEAAEEASAEAIEVAKEAAVVASSEAAKEVVENIAAAEAREVTEVAMTDPTLKEVQDAAEARTSQAPPSSSHPLRTPCQLKYESPS